MNLRILRYFFCATAIAFLSPSSAHAVWSFQSVRSYGATGNGSTDDTAAINAAIAGGTVVYFPPGTYKYIGAMTLPSNTSYRLYGDGPGVSTILFTGNPTTGISGPFMGTKTLNVEGLTLKANSYNCGTAISASFSEAGASTKFRTAAIHNVEIIGSTRDGYTGFYWSNGIYLYQAQNSVIDKVQIGGNNSSAQGPPSQTGIVWASSSGYATTGLQLSNLEIIWVNTALRTSGWVEGVYLTGFELTFCGQNGMPVVDLAVNAPGGVQKPTFHLLNGHIQGLEGGIRLTNLTDVKIAKVHFLHNAGALPGTMVDVENCTDVVVSQCNFLGNALNGGSSLENGILLNNANSVRIAGNDFDFMTPSSGGSGSCVVVQPNCSVVRITYNLFGAVGQKYNDPGMIAYKWGNN
jgi:polygalacturonase